MKKGIMWLVITCMCLLVLSGCSSNTKSQADIDSLKVYDTQNHLVKSIKGPKSITEFDKFFNEKDDQREKVSLPHDAKPSYRYVIHRAHRNITVKMTVYRNYPVAKLAGVPKMDKVTVSLKPAEFIALNAPGPDRR